MSVRRVYLVMGYDYDDTLVAGVFSSRRKADDERERLETRSVKQRDEDDGSARYDWSVVERIVL